MWQACVVADPGGRIKREHGAPSCKIDKDLKSK